MAMMMIKGSFWQDLIGIRIIQPERKGMPRLGRTFEPPAQTTDATSSHQVQPVLSPRGPGRLVGSQQNR